MLRPQGRGPPSQPPELVHLRAQPHLNPCPSSWVSMPEIHRECLGQARLQSPQQLSSLLSLGSQRSPWNVEGTLRVPLCPATSLSLSHGPPGHSRQNRVGLHALSPPHQNPRAHNLHACCPPRAQGPHQPATLSSRELTSRSANAWTPLPSVLPPSTDPRQPE